jgi:hypothetical protein
MQRRHHTIYTTSISLAVHYRKATLIIRGCRRRCCCVNSICCCRDAH